MGAVSELFAAVCDEIEENTILYVSLLGAYVAWLLIVGTACIVLLWSMRRKKKQSDLELDTRYSILAKRVGEAQQVGL